MPAQPCDHQLGQLAAVIYQNGHWLTHDQAGYDVQDRGVLFADGLYEVIRYDHGRAFRMAAHMQRLATGLAAFDFPAINLEQLASDADELITRNALVHARLYLQVTRGRAARSFVIDHDATPTVTMLAFAMPELQLADDVDTGRAILVEDTRWMRCNIKTTMLLPASLAKTQAASRGATEAIFLRHKPGTETPHITEGASTNVMAVIKGKLQTHPADNWILPGITRTAVLEHATEAGIDIVESPLTKAQLLDADEVFVCSTTQFTAITHIDEQVIGDGHAGALTRDLDQRLRKQMLSVHR